MWRFITALMFGLLVGLVVGALDYWVKGVGYVWPLVALAAGVWLYRGLK